MAARHVQPQQISEDDQAKNLKYLDFVQVAAIRAVVCVSSLYGFAKENSGPLKPGVQAVEGTVKTVVGPVVNKFHDVPLELLTFVDRKVDESLQELDRHLPSQVKEAYTTVQKAPEVVRSVAGEVQKAGVVGSATGIARAVYEKYKPAAKGLYVKYEPVAEQCAVKAWRSLNQLPLVPQVAHILVPTVAYWSERYNQSVCYAAEQGYTVSAYMPLVPTDKIAKVFGNTGTTPVEVVAG